MIHHLKPKFNWYFIKLKYRPSEIKNWIWALFSIHQKIVYGLESFKELKELIFNYNIIIPHKSSIFYYVT